MIESPACELPEAARSTLEVLSGMIAVLESPVKLLDSEIARRAKFEDVPRRLMTIPGVGPITATALAALAPPPHVFGKGRDFVAPALRNAKRSFCAWTDPVAKINRRQADAGGDIEDGGANLATAAHHGASAVVCQAARRGAQPGSWPARMLARKPRMLVITALANKMARTVWALMAKNEIYRAPVVAS
jgi:transposase